MLPNGFTFDAASHIYRIKERIIPGCTRVLDHSGLVDYSVVREDILERKSQLGQIVHIGTHFDDEGSLDWDTVAEEAKPRIDAWRQFRADTGFVPRLREVQFVGEINGMQYGMQIDAEGILRKRAAVVEIKTCEQFHWWHAVQTAGYRAGIPYLECPSPLSRFFSRDGYVVLLRSTGKYKLEGPFTARKDYDVFASALHITHVRMQHGKPIQEIELEDAA